MNKEAISINTPKQIEYILKNIKFFLMLSLLTILIIRALDKIADTTQITNLTTSTVKVPGSNTLIILITLITIAEGAV